MNPAFSAACMLVVAGAGACGWGGDNDMLAAPRALLARPAPPPSSVAGMIVFVRVRGTTNTLMAMKPDGSGVVSLGATGWHPHVSPDGKKIVYSTPDEGIAVLDLATMREARLASRVSARPRWSPDGNRILFWSDRGGSKELYTMKPDGSGPVRLSDGGDGYHEGSWSPDGSRIVFRRVTGDGEDIWTMNADGSGAAPLYAGERMDLDPEWSPDGKRIAFVRVVPRAHGAGTTSEIFTINADGSNPVRLTNHDGGHWAPAWSPDGSRIAFFGYHTSATDPDLFTVNADGSDLAVLLGGPTYDHGPAFGPRQ